jgi:hypothetical protein
MDDHFSLAARNLEGTGIARRTDRDCGIIGFCATDGFAILLAAAAPNYGQGPERH